MQIFNFHLMPYADGDMESLKRHGTAWLTYPNENYDPKVGSATEELLLRCSEPLPNRSRGGS